MLGSFTGTARGQSPAAIAFEFLQDDELTVSAEIGSGDCGPARAFCPVPHPELRSIGKKAGASDHARIAKPRRAIPEPGNDLRVEAEGRFGYRRESRGLAGCTKIVFDRSKSE